MKRIVLLSAIMLFNTVVKIKAQTIYTQPKEEVVQLGSDTTTKLFSFSGKYNSEKIYLHWMVTNLHEDGMFQVYRSVDEINYENIGTKQSVGVPISKAIAYYFTDENSEEGNMYYKLQYISKTNGYIVGDRITVPSQCLLECPITPTLIATDK